MKSTPRASKSQKSQAKNAFITWVNTYGGIRLAKKLGIDPSAVSHWRRGIPPRVEHMRRIVALSKGTVTYDHIIDGGQ